MSSSGSLTKCKKKKKLYIHTKPRVEEIMFCKEHITHILHLLCVHMSHYTNTIQILVDLLFSPIS